MFVDNSHRVRARLAEGLFDRIAAWNGVGLILYGVRTFRFSSIQSHKLPLSLTQKLRELQVGSLPNGGAVDSGTHVCLTVLQIGVDTHTSAREPVKHVVLCPSSF